METLGATHVKVHPLEVLDLTTTTFQEAPELGGGKRKRDNGQGLLGFESMF